MICFVCTIKLAHNINLSWSKQFNYFILFHSQQTFFHPYFWLLFCECNSPSIIILASYIIYFFFLPWSLLLILSFFLELLLLESFDDCMDIDLHICFLFVLQFHNDISIVAFVNFFTSHFHNFAFDVLSDFLLSIPSLLKSLHFQQQKLIKICNPKKTCII